MADLLQQIPLQGGAEFLFPRPGHSVKESREVLLLPFVQRRGCLEIPDHSGGITQLQQMPLPQTTSHS